MPEIDKTKRPDLTDLADDDIQAVEDPKAREALYRMAEKVRAILIYQEDLITDLYAAVTAIEDELP